MSAVGLKLPITIVTNGPVDCEMNLTKPNMTAFSFSGKCHLHDEAGNVTIQSIPLHSVTKVCLCFKKKLPEMEQITNFFKGEWISPEQQICEIVGKEKYWSYQITDRKAIISCLVKMSPTER